MDEIEELMCEIVYDVFDGLPAPDGFESARDFMDYCEFLERSEM